MLVGLDNLQLSSVIGLMGLKAKRRWMLVATFVLFEVSMPLVGMLIGNRLNSSFENVAEWFGAAFLISLGLFILIREWRERGEQDIVNNKWFLILLPFFMSLDNLAAGLGLGTVGYPIVSTSLIVGLCAGSMCLLGLVIGDRLRRIRRLKVELISGIYLIGLGIYWVL